MCRFVGLRSGELNTGIYIPAWLRLDLNQRSPGYEPGGIPNFPTERCACRDDIVYPQALNAER